MICYLKIVVHHILQDLYLQHLCDFSDTGSNSQPWPIGMGTVWSPSVLNIGGLVRVDSTFVVALFLADQMSWSGSGLTSGFWPHI